MNFMYLINLMNFKTTIFIAITVSFLLFPLFTAHALTVSPAVLELTAEPGETAKGTITLFNETNQVLGLVIQTASFTQTEDRALTEILPVASDLALWVRVAEPRITLNSGEKKYIDFEVQVPSKVTQAGNYGVIFFTQPGTENGVSVASRVGSLILLTIPSLADEREMEIVDFGITDQETVLKYLPIDFFARIKNTGNAHLLPAGTIEIKNLLTKKTRTVELNQQAGRILPGIIRRFTAYWPDLAGSDLTTERGRGRVFWQRLINELTAIKVGYYQATLNIQAGPDSEIKTAQLKFWLFPWRTTGLIIILALLVWLIWGIIKKNKRRI